MKQFYVIRTYKQYDRDVKLAVRRGLDIEKLLSSAKARNGSPGIHFPERKSSCTVENAKQRE